MVYAVQILDLVVENFGYQSGELQLFTRVGVDMFVFGRHLLIIIGKKRRVGAGTLIVLAMNIFGLEFTRLSHVFV